MGAAGSLARHSHEGEEAWERSWEAEERIASTRDDAGKDECFRESPQQPHSEVGRLAQQAFGAGAGFVEQADATSANESIPMIAVKAMRKMFELGRRVVIAFKFLREMRGSRKPSSFYSAYPY